MSAPTLVEFLTARLDEEEGWAKAARGWQTGSRHEGQPLDWSIHMDRWSPDRVLADVAAKRRIVERAAAHRKRSRRASKEYSRWVEGRPVPEPGTPSFASDPDVQRALDDVLRALASVYADHPDFDATWAP